MSKKKTTLPEFQIKHSNYLKDKKRVILLLTDKAKSLAHAKSNKKCKSCKGYFEIESSYIFESKIEKQMHQLYITQKE